MGNNNILAVAVSHCHWVTIMYHVELVVVVVPLGRQLL